MFKKVLDLTYPVTSMFSGAAFNSGISNVFKSKQIEVSEMRLLNLFSDPGVKKRRSSRINCLSDVSL